MCGGGWGGVVWGVGSGEEGKGAARRRKIGIINMRIIHYVRVEPKLNKERGGKGGHFIVFISSQKDKYLKKKKKNLIKSIGHVCLHPFIPP